MDRPYVYALIDPRDGAVFYIGKGTGRRMHAHQADVKRGRIVNASKSDRIQCILAAGLSVRTEVLSQHATEAQAYAAERRAIAAHQALTNANAGGGGSYCGAVGTGDGRRESPAAAMRKATALLDRLVPYMDWTAERQRSPAELALRSFVVDGLVEIVEACRAALGLRATGSRRAGVPCPA